MIVEGIDPRDTEWEVEGPVYHSDEYRLSGAVDVGEVLDWARTIAKPDQTFSLHVEHRHGDSPGLIHLMGVDPTVST